MVLTYERALTILPRLLLSLPILVPSLALAADPVRPLKPHSAADYELHIAELKKRLPSDEFQIVVQPPFVVVGDESLEVLKTRAKETIHWAVTRLKREYFAQDPNVILDIWLFRDKESYEKHVLALFGEKPSTPFGYYSRRNRALIMNIETGGGTLVHEIVHPFIEANFPECPSWFNEGLASLYEQCGENRGRIWGYVNWRLRGLHGAIDDKSLASFEDLCGTTTHEFYESDRGANYAQARYLCFYLQQRGLLNKYYHEFRKGVKEDPTGYKTLCRVLGDPEMEEFQRDWEAYVLRLKL